MYSWFCMVTWDSHILSPYYWYLFQICKNSVLHLYVDIYDMDQGSPWLAVGKPEDECLVSLGLFSLLPLIEVFDLVVKIFVSVQTWGSTVVPHWVQSDHWWMTQPYIGTDLWPDWEPPPHTRSHSCLSPSYLCSILQTWRWACEGSGSTFSHSLSKLMWIGEKQRDRMWCHLAIDSFSATTCQVRTVAPGSVLLRPPTPTRPPPLFLSPSLLSCFFSHSSILLLQLRDCTKQPNRTSWSRTICIFAYSVYGTVHTLQSQTDVSAFCIISYPQSLGPKTKGQNPIYPQV